MFTGRRGILVLSLFSFLIAAGCGRSISVQPGDKNLIPQTTGATPSPTPTPTPTPTPGTTSLPPLGQGDPKFVGIITLPGVSQPDPITVAVPKRKKSWCGLISVVDSYSVATSVDGTFGNFAIPCHGKNPSQTGCPTGYSYLQVNLLPYVDEASSGAFGTCIPPAEALEMPTTDDGSWCGVANVNSGTYPSTWLNGSTTNGHVDCLGHNPAVSCPSGYARFGALTTAWHIDSIADYTYTCIQKAGTLPQSGTSGNWSGVYASAGVPAASNAIGAAGGVGTILNDGVNPNEACPSGSNKFALSSSAWNAQATSSWTATCVNQ